MVHARGNEQGEGGSLHSSFSLAVRDANRVWVLAFDLERVMADYADSNSLDFDEISAFVELITRDGMALAALGPSWDPR